MRLRMLHTGIAWHRRNARRRRRRVIRNTDKGGRGSYRSPTEVIRRVLAERVNEN